MPKSDKQLENLTKAIEKLLSKEVAPIAPVLPVAPVLPIIPTNSGDHDLLTKLDTKVDQIQFDVTALKAQNSIYITRTEFIEVVKIQADHEARIKLLENTTTKLWAYGTALIFIVGLAEFFISKLWK